MQVFALPNSFHRDCIQLSFDVLFKNLPEVLYFAVVRSICYHYAIYVALFDKSSLDKIFWEATSHVYECMELAVWCRRNYVNEPIL